MVSAYWQEPLYQADVARWLQTSELGTPSSRVQRLTQYGFEVVYQSGSLELLRNWLHRQSPPILFVRTGSLPYWPFDTPHALVCIGLTDDQAVILDPASRRGRELVPLEALMLAWSFLDYTYAILYPTDKKEHL